MVSLSLFTIVAVVAVGAFLKIIDANKQSQSLQTAMNNTDFALESMVREMRVGSDYTCFNAANPPAFSVQLSNSSANNCSFSAYQYNGIAFDSSQTAFINNTDASGGTCNLIHVYEYYDNYDANASPRKYTLEKAEQSRCSDVIGSNAAPFIPLVSSDLNIQTFDVMVSGEGVSGLYQPKAFFLLRAYAGPTAAERTYFTAQTTASQRTMNSL